MFLQMWGTFWPLSLKKVRNKTQLRYLFSGPRKNDVLLLEDIDTAGIRHEKMEADTSEKSELDET
ncbi:hypothetical protein BU25DRAFT_463017 [Macroventuria anomochaeta]|uniref:Uncharacterized protein n=1 Tax=Macroventuria anomochaeta TaxID=301207 RepID=A0ACB6RK19_9PLEO|nr:uncharacterized protein BU25DRAFT_463017 [Macroventuria anomochaeta]KAF2622260.1 hypothetical protein BU25DRAFT_463017 [Macroventuria anomochaeta]